MDWEKVIEVLDTASREFGKAASEGTGNATAFASGMLVAATLADAFKVGLASYRRPLNERERMNAGIEGYANAHPERTASEVASWFGVSEKRVNEVLSAGSVQ